MAATEELALGPLPNQPISASANLSLLVVALLRGAPMPGLPRIFHASFLATGGSKKVRSNSIRLVRGRDPMNQVFCDQKSSFRAALTCSFVTVKATILGYETTFSQENA